MHIPFLESCKEAGVIYRCISVAPERLLEYLLSILGAGDRVSDGPLVGEDLVIIATLRFLTRLGTGCLVRLVAGEMYLLEAPVLDRYCPNQWGGHQMTSLRRWG